MRKQQSIINKYEKCQITVVLGETMNKEFLSVQFVYKEPTNHFLSCLDNGYSYDHWQNEKTTSDYACTKPMLCKKVNT